MDGACASSTYKSTETPVVSTLSELRSKQLISVLGGVTVLLAALVGWQVWHPPEPSSARALGSLDATLVQSWGRLPQGVQEQLSGAYAAVGLRSPGARQPARK